MKYVSVVSKLCPLAHYQVVKGYSIKNNYIFMGLHPLHQMKCSLWVATHRLRNAGLELHHAETNILELR